MNTYKKNGNFAELEITVENEAWTKAKDLAFKEVSKDLKMDGFRAGKVPKSMYLKKYGEESLLQDAIDFALQEEYTSAIEEHELKVVARPDVEIKEVDVNKMVALIKVALHPEVTLGEYKNLGFTKEVIEVTEEMINDEIKKNLEHHTELVVVDRAVQNDDSVVIDYKGTVDGVAFDGGTADNQTLVIGSGQFIPGFEEQLVGKLAGESLDVLVTFPEEYHAADLAAKDAVFAVTIHEVKEKSLPELSDEFVLELAIENVSDVASYKEFVKANIEKTKTQDADAKYLDEIIEKVVENSTFEIHDEMIEAEKEKMLNQFSQQLAQQGMNLELYTQFTGQTADDLKAQMSVDAVKRISAGLIIDAIVEAEKVVATDEEAEAELENIAKMYNMSVEEIRPMLPNNEVLKNDVVIKKALDVLKAHN